MVVAVTSPADPAEGTDARDRGSSWPRRTDRGSGTSATEENTMSDLAEPTSSKPLTLPPHKDRRMERRAAIGASLGTVLEYFDFAIFGLLAATVFPTVFFPELDGATALTASFATYGVAFAARPIGSVVFA